VSKVGQWTGTRLVASRAMREGVASRSWRIITGVMLLIGIGAALLPRLLGGGETTYTLAAAAGTPEAVVAQVQAAGNAGGFEVQILAVADRAAAEAAVRDGEATAGLAMTEAGSTLYVASDGAGPFPAVVSQVVVGQATTQALRDAGLTDEQITAILSLPPPEQVPVGRVEDQSRAAVGFIVGIVLYMALILTGTAIASAVATEKSTRISEVLLAVLRPTQLLVGTVVGVGLLGLAQVTALGVPAAIGLATGDDISVPSSAVGDIALGFGWLILGLLLYAFVFAALGSLVEKVSEVGAATIPANVVLVGSYLIAVTITTEDPNGPVPTIASLFPVSAPMVMPVRWTSGLVPVWQLVLAMGLTALAAVGLAIVASRIYARGVATTGRRVRLLEVLRRA
jgi:ABC-2 type transport system permease protein